MDQSMDPAERDREDEDLEMDAEQAEDVKGGALIGETSTKLPLSSPTTTTTTTTSTTTTSTPPPIRRLP